MDISLDLAYVAILKNKLDQRERSSSVRTGAAVMSVWAIPEAVVGS
jgi:hypothetical protein